RWALWVLVSRGQATVSRTSTVGPCRAAATLHGPTTYVRRAAGKLWRTSAMAGAVIRTSPTWSGRSNSTRSVLPRGSGIVRDRPRAARRSRLRRALARRLALTLTLTLALTKLRRAERK